MGKNFETRALVHDNEDSIVSQNYAELKEHGFFAAAIPVELGGAGLFHSGMCEVLRTVAQ